MKDVKHRWKIYKEYPMVSVGLIKVYVHVVGENKKII